MSSVRDDAEQRSHLCEAILRGDYVYAQEILPKEISDFKETVLLLHMVCDKKNIATCIKSDPLRMGARTDLVRMILTHTDIDVTKTDSLQRTSLMLACAAGDANIVGFMAKSCKYDHVTTNAINAIDDYGFSALSYCCMYGTNIMLSALLDMGANVLEGVYRYSRDDTNSVLHGFRVNIYDTRTSMIEKLVSLAPELVFMRNTVSDLYPLQEYVQRFLVCRGGCNQHIGTTHFHRVTAIDLSVVRVFMSVHHPNGKTRYRDEVASQVVDLAIEQRMQQYAGLRQSEQIKLRTSIDILKDIKIVLDAP
jgi:hypothetical protein